MNPRHLICAVFLCVATAPAQDKITVPLSNPSQPATVKMHLMGGNITVTAGTGNQVVIETVGGTSAGRHAPEPPPGMHRIDGGASFNVEEDHNVVTIGGGGMHPGSESYNIQVPASSSLQLKTMSGHIDVTGISGAIEIDSANGPIALKNVGGSVLAHSLNGGIVASLDRVTADKPMSFTSLNGKIEVTLPGDTKARLRLKTDRGEVYTDFDVKVEADASKPAVEDSRGKGGKYVIRMDRGVYGSINGGGPEYRFETMNGSILIHKK